jgi:holo-[acyl-carrier protein] synthase
VSAILGLGLDLVEISRIRAALDRHGERFLARIAGEYEGRLADAQRGTAFAEHVAGLFAAKEAVLKALGTGAAVGAALRDVIVERGAHGQPTVRLVGGAARHAEERGVARIHLSITHERGHAAAVAILESGAPRS